VKKVIDGDKEKQIVSDHQEEVQHFQFKATEEVTHTLFTV